VFTFTRYIQRRQLNFQNSCRREGGGLVVVSRCKGDGGVEGEGEGEGEDIEQGEGAGRCRAAVAPAAVISASAAPATTIASAAPAAAPNSSVFRKDCRPRAASPPRLHGVVRTAATQLRRKACSSHEWV